MHNSERVPYRVAFRVNFHNHQVVAAGVLREVRAENRNRLRVVLGVTLGILYGQARFTLPLVLRVVHAGVFGDNVPSARHLNRGCR